MFNDNRIAEKSEDLQMTNIVNFDQREGRLRAIAINAVREARLAYGRDHLPWTDDDARRSEMHFKLLHLIATEEIDRASEHAPVVAPEQAPHNPKLVNVDKLLDDINKLDESEPATVGLKLPTAKVASK